MSLVKLVRRGTLGTDIQRRHFVACGVNVCVNRAGKGTDRKSPVIRL